jgi:NPCBM/NEW2 domain
MRTIVSIVACLTLAAVLVMAVAQAAGSIYLSDLPLKPVGLKYQNSGYFDGIRVNSHASIITMSGSQSWGWDRPTRINMQLYPKSILFHVVHDETVGATWALNHRYSTLTAMIGLDDTQDIPGVYPYIAVKFIGDKKNLGGTSFATAYGKPFPTPSLNLNVTGVNSLTVEITFKGTGGGTNLDIVNPELQPTN